MKSDAKKEARRAKNEADRLAIEEGKRKAMEESERKVKEEAEQLIKNRVETLQKIIKRSTKLNVTTLSEMLKMEKNDMLMWLYDLPDEFGFNIADDMVEFDVVNIDTAIDNLIASYETMEDTKRGKND